MWVFRGLRDGIVTTRWPAHPDPYAEATRGPATVIAQPGVPNVDVIGPDDDTPTDAPESAVRHPDAAPHEDTTDARGAHLRQSDASGPGSSHPDADPGAAAPARNGAPRRSAPDEAAMTSRGEETSRTGGATTSGASLGEDPPPGSGNRNEGRPWPAGSLAGLCPSGAIRDDGDGLAVDQGRCVQCGRCVDARPDLFAWTLGPATATTDRRTLLVPNDDGGDGGRLAHARDALRRRTRALRRSVHVRHVDAGSDGSDEWEVLALLNPVYDVHRLGIFFTASPRHADILLVTGAGARGMTEPLCRTYEGMPDPRIVIAAGTDALSGGMLTGSYALTSGVGDTLPVDVWVPGSPSTPFALLHALLLAVGRLTATPAQPIGAAKR